MGGALIFRIWTTPVVGALLLMVGGCSVFSKDQVKLGEIYNQKAKLPDYERNPVIVIPGILGSRLIDAETEEVYWGEIGAKDSNPYRTSTLAGLALPMELGRPLSELRDDVSVDGPLDQLTFKVFGVPIRVNAYAQVLSALGVAGYRDQNFGGYIKSNANQVEYADDHFTCFQFTYDWRRDISETALELQKFVDEVHAYTRDQYQQRYGIENADVKIDIVAHSMGGLVARYYLRYGGEPLPDDGSLPELTWAGSEKISRAFLIGTPNGGAAQSITEMRDGMRLASALPKYPAAILGTMPAVYQLLPRTQDEPLVTESGKTLDLLAPETWEQLRWCLSDPQQDRTLKKIMPGTSKQQRKRIANDHQLKCLVRARQFHDSLDRPALPPPGLELHLYAGDAVKTLDSLVVNPVSGKIVEERTVAGDGTVTRTSALTEFESGAEGQTQTRIPWAKTTFLSTDHLELTRDRAFVDNILNSLFERAGDSNAGQTLQVPKGTEFSSSELTPSLPTVINTVTSEPTHYFVTPASGNAGVDPPSDDSSIQLSSATILHPHVLRGSNYQIKDNVVIADHRFLFTLTTSHGEVQAWGIPMLEKRIRELRAIERAEGLSRQPLELEVKGAYSTISSTIYGANDLLSDPFGSLKQLSHQAIGARIENDKPPALNASTQARRRIAIEVGADSETNHPVLSQLLTELANRESLGASLTKELLDEALPGLELLSELHELNRESVNQSPAEIAEQINHELEQAGFSRYVREGFAFNRAFTSTEKLIYFHYFRNLINVQHAEDFLRAMIESINSESDVLDQIVKVRLLSDLHQKHGATAVHAQGILYVVLKNSDVVGVCSLDYLQDTEEVRDAISRFRNQRPDETLVFYSTGQLSPAVSQWFDRADIRFVKASY